MSILALLQSANPMETQQQLLRSLPKVDECLARLDPSLVANAPASIIKQTVQKVIEAERAKILAGANPRTVLSVEQWQDLFIQAIISKMQPRFRRVINASGVVIHTNLGRSILSEDATASLLQAGSYYSNLEFDLQTGKRGSRYSLVEEILCDLSGAEAAIVVNNNAAAVFLALDSLALGREVIVSRGQLVEIGGSFRIPDIMAKSGARLVEVGATNRTHIFDYEQAVTAETALLLRVHTSNFRLIGFTAEVSPEELAAIAQRHGLLTMEDLGSGSLVDLSHYGLPKEPTVQEVVKAGIDVVTFSGDKLLGGPQAGIIVGRREVIARIKKNPLNRALRVDKFTLASLERTLRCYYDIPKALQEVPTLAMLTVSPALLKKRGQKLLRRIGHSLANHCTATLVPTLSRVGGGAIPEYNLDSWAVSLAPLKASVSLVDRDFRQLPLPIVGRIENDRYILDMRTIQDREINELATILTTYFGKGGDRA